MYKQIQKLQSSGKMRVTPEQSESVQKVLLEMGYASANEHPEEYPACRNIYWSSSNKQHGCNNFSENFFSRQPEPLHIFTDYFTTEPLK